MAKPLCIALLFLVSAAFAPNTGLEHTYGGTATADYVAFRPGEKLTYSLHFGPVNAGEAILEVKKDMKEIAGVRHYHLYVEGRSYKIFDPFYKVRDYYESFIDEKTLFPTVFIRNVQEGSYKKEEFYIFDRKHNTVKSGNKNYPVPPGIHDIISAFYYLRCIDFSRLQVGADIDFSSFFENEIFPLGVQYTGKAIINTRLGKVSCMTFKPKLIEGRVFKGQSDMTIYVSDDKNQLPVRIESAVYLGYVRADLVEYNGIKYPLTALLTE